VFINEINTVLCIHNGQKYIDILKVSYSVYMYLFIYSAAKL